MTAPRAGRQRNGHLPLRRDAARTEGSSPARAGVPEARPAAPPVTVVDPARPGRAADILEAGPERLRWRPTRPQAQVALLMLLLCAAVSGAIAAARHASAQHRQEVAAVRALALVVTEPVEGADSSGVPGEPGPQQFRIALRNEGPQEVRLVAVRLDYPGFGWQPAPSRLASFESRNLTVDSTPRCSPSLAQQGPQRLSVRVVTSRGTPREMSLGLLDGAVGLDVTEHVQGRCGDRPLSQSLEMVDSAGPGTRNGLLVLELTLRNDSVLPLTVTKVRALPEGLRLTSDRRLPLTLPPRPTPEADSRAQSLVLRLQVSSCARLRARGPENSAALAFTLTRGDERISASVGLYGDVTSALALLLRGCPPALQVVPD